MSHLKNINSCSSLLWSKEIAIINLTLWKWKRGGMICWGQRGKTGINVGVKAQRLRLWAIPLLSRAVPGILFWVASRDVHGTSLCSSVSFHTTCSINTKVAQALEQQGKPPCLPFLVCPLQSPWTQCPFSSVWRWHPDPAEGEHSLVLTWGQSLGFVLTLADTAGAAGADSTARAPTHLPQAPWALLHTPWASQELCHTGNKWHKPCTSHQGEADAAPTASWLWQGNRPCCALKAGLSQLVLFLPSDTSDPQRGDLVPAVAWLSHSKHANSAWHWHKTAFPLFNDTCTGNSYLN